MKPLNPDAEHLLFMSHFRLHERAAETLAQIPDDEDIEVTLVWQNATIIARAGTIRAWIEREQLLRS